MQTDPRKTNTARRRKKKKANPLLKIGAGLLSILLIVALSSALTALLPKTERTLSSAAVEETPVSTPTPEPTITPTPAVYAPFGAQYGFGGADLIPETPSPAPTAVPTNAPTPTPKPIVQPEPTEKTYTTLRKGSTGPSVKALQEELKNLGYLSGKADGNFGSNTHNAVVQFQAVNGLAADGLAGNQTQALLFSGSALPASAAPEMDYLLLVNRKNKLDKHFAPTDLVKIEDVIPASVLKVKYKGTQANRTAVEALGRMLEDAIEEGITNWQVSSAYRTHADQQALVDESVNKFKKNNPSWSKARCLSATYQTVAPSGTSEHQTGLAFDITVPGVSFTGTEQQKWLHEHCYEYGFIVRFTEDKQSKTGFLAESWHFRYVGIEAAQVMTFNNWCLEEYVEIMGL